MMVKLNSMSKTFVIALGGSVIMPGEINTSFIKRFRKLILKQIGAGKRFIIVAGGGKLARNYQAAAAKITPLPHEDMDWLGIHSTRLNAHLLRTVFGKEAEPAVINSEEKPVKSGKSIIIASGWRPGWSTDYVAIRLAKKIGVDSAIMAGKPDYVYDKDYQIYKNAKPIKKIFWKDYQKLIPKRWIPGFSSPVDPIAARFARKWRIKAYIVRGENLKNLEGLLNGEKFKGTLIS